ncbi:MAG: hypothetical protein ACTSXF_01970 [Promethearchaeota archaeon]
MDATAEANIREILRILGDPIAEGDFHQLLRKTNKDLNAIAQNLLEFLGYIPKRYLDNEEFREKLFEILKISLEIIEDASEEEIPDVLLKTFMINFLDLYFNYTEKGGDKKDTILNILGQSLEKLEPKAQVLNVCLLVDPILRSEAYKENKARIEEKEVTYEAEISNAAIEIKHEIDVWIKNQDLDLNKQEETIENLKIGLKNLAEQKGIKIDSEEYKELELECIEMLNMQFTMISLMAELGDEEDLAPKPINQMI